MKGHYKNKYIEAKGVPLLQVMLKVKRDINNKRKTEKMKEIKK